MYPFIREKGTFCCWKSRYETCCNIKQTDAFDSFVRKNYKANHSFNCDRKHLIYVFSYKVCDIQYLGSTVVRFWLSSKKYNSYQRNIAEGRTTKTISINIIHCIRCIKICQKCITLNWVVMERVNWQGQDVEKFFIYLYIICLRNLFSSNLRKNMEYHWLSMNKNKKALKTKKVRSISTSKAANEWSILAEPAPLMKLGLIFNIKGKYINFTNK